MVAGVATLLCGCNGSGATGSSGPVHQAAEHTPFGARVASSGRWPPSAAGEESGDRSGISESSKDRRPRSLPRFQDVHGQAGLRHVYGNGARGRCLLFETPAVDQAWVLDQAEAGEPSASTGGPATANGGRRTLP